MRSKAHFEALGGGTEGPARCDQHSMPLKVC